MKGRRLDELAKRAGVQSVPPDTEPETEPRDLAARHRYAIGLLVDLERTLSRVRDFLDEENAR